jgi:hypothetical protein
MTDRNNKEIHMKELLTKELNFVSGGLVPEEFLDETMAYGSYPQTSSSFYLSPTYQCSPPAVGGYGHVLVNGSSERSALEEESALPMAAYLATMLGGADYGQIAAAATRYRNRNKYSDQL